MTDTPKSPPERPIRFFCRLCGKELWESMGYEQYKDETLDSLLNHLKCAGYCVTPGDQDEPK